MKINSFMLGAAALLLATSCSNDEVVKVAENSQAIGFSSFVNNATRAVDNDANTLNDLKVWGIALQPDATTPYNVFANVLVSKEITNAELTKTDWKYSDTRYWVANNQYTFTAVAPASAVSAATDETKTAAVVTPGTDMTKGAVASIAFTNDGTIDLLYDAQDVEAATSASAYDVVAFNLRHILSRVRFEFKNELAEGYSIQISNLNITNAKTTGTFATGATEAWTVTETPGNIAFAFDGTEVVEPEFVDTAAAEASAKSQPSYLFPAEEEAYNVTFTVALYQADALTGDLVLTETYNHTAIIPAREYKLGYSYAFKTVINADNVDPLNPKYPIEFTATVEDWIDATKDKNETEVPFPKTEE